LEHSALSSTPSFVFSRFLLLYTGSFFLHWTTRFDSLPSYTSTSFSFSFTLLFHFFLLFVHRAPGRAT
jgi:hypothetical protein